MVKKSFFLVSIVLFFVITSCGSSKSHVSSGKSGDQLIGVWQISFPALGGAGAQEKMKIFTKTRFIWYHTVNGDIVMSHGGTYSFDGETLTEHIKFGSPNERIAFGRKFITKIRFEGNMMYTTGGWENDSRVLSEIWERVE